MVNPVLSDPELRRFQLQMHLPGINREGQEKMKAARIAVIGAGGTGASVLQNLAAHGTGYLGIIDDGLVNEINIQRQTLYGGTDLGKLKTIISRQHLQQLFPMSTYEIINLRLTADNILSVLRPFHLVVDASNDIQSSTIINDACIRLQKPWVYAHVSGYQVDVSVFNYQHGPSFRCLPENNRQETTGAIACAYGLAGVFVSVEVIKIIAGLNQSLSGRLLTFNAFDYNMKVEAISRDEHNFRPAAQTIDRS